MTSGEGLRWKRIDVPSVGVYALLRDGVVVYVGQSTFIPRRLEAHRQRGIDFDAVMVHRATPDDDLAYLESLAIETLRPTMNVQRHRVDRHRRRFLDEIVLHSMLEDLRRGKSMREIAREYGVSISRARHWMAVQHTRETGEFVLEAVRVRGSMLPEVSP